MHTSSCADLRHKDRPISSFMRMDPRFMRSVHLERDVMDPLSSMGYVLTPVAKHALERITASFQPGSTQRAWRVSGDYGCGKTALALILARVAAAKMDEVPKAVTRFAKGPTLQPVLATGDSEPLAQTVMRALGREKKRGKIHSEEVLAAVVDTVTSARRKRHNGVLLILDELGKNLEHAARNPDLDDIFILQRLAEEAARSGDKPLVLVVMLHQGVMAYSAGLDSVAKREWTKVAGRFEEIVYSQPMEQVATLAHATLSTRTDALPKNMVSKCMACMKQAIAVGLYGSSPAVSLVNLAAGLFPLHPTVLPVLVRTMRRFAQNERSLFSFFASAEPAGLQEHSSRSVSEAGYYRIHHLYDYVRQNLAPSMLGGGSHTYWGVVEAVIDSARVESIDEEHVLKTVGLLNLLDAPNLAPTEHLVRLALADTDVVAGKAVKAAIYALRSRGVLYERGTVSGLCLWPHTSVNLDEAFARGLEATQTDGDGIATLCANVRIDQLVPRGHYVRMGTLRYADVSLIPAGELSRLFEKQPALEAKGPDLHLRIVLPKDRLEERQAKETLERCHGSLNDGLFIGIAEPPAEALPSLMDLIAWRWVKDNTPELAGDRYAREEVTRQVAAAERTLRERLRRLFELATAGGRPLQWFSRDAAVLLAPGRDLLTYFGTQCDKIYAKAPRILNELINRRCPSSSAVAARTKLVEAMDTAPDRPNLGMDDDRRPAEMALYLSVLKAGNLHVPNKAGDLHAPNREQWVFRLPDKEHDNRNLLPALNQITHTLISAGADSLVPVPELFRVLSLPPYGIREGLLPFILAIYLAAHHQRTALYEDGTYLSRVPGGVFLRMMKEPQAFGLQYCALEGVRAGIFRSLLEYLKLKPRDNAKEDLIDLVRPLVVFVAKEIPEYARRTDSLSATAIAVRRALLNAREPVRLIFTLLPVACGMQPITPKTDADSVDPGEFGGRLAAALQEIRTAYSKLVERLGKAICAAFDAVRGVAEERAAIQYRAAQLLASVTEPNLKAFAVRLADTSLGDRAWIESVATLLARKSPERWADVDESDFYHQLELIAGRFRRVEATLSLGAKMKLNGNACRIAITKTDGSEVNDLVRWDDVADETLGSIKMELGDIISRHGRRGLAAAMKVLWEELERSIVD
jgi:hypothetical protein